MITREDVQDLQPGDVVVAAHAAWPKESFIRGELYRQKCASGLYCCGFQVADRDGNVYLPDLWSEVTVVSRAPRPLYVNSDKTEPDPGDVVRDADSEYPDDQRTWMLDAGGHYPTPWRCGFIGGSYTRADLPDRLRLLVDGRTGQAVPS